MKKLFLAITVSLLAFQSLAATKTINSMEENKTQIDVFRVADSIVLGANKEKDITIRLVSEYLGQSTDLSPKKNLYLTYFHGSEMSNTTTSFNLGSVWELKSTKRISAGIYQITYVDLELETKTITIDTTQVSVDDKNLSSQQLQDVYFKSSIKISE